MSIPKKTAGDFATDLESAILDRNANYDTKVGPVPDLVINPVANVLELQNDRIRSVQQLLSLQNDGSWTSDDLNAFVYNELMVRNSNSGSTVNLIFSRLAPPTVDVTVQTNFPVATLTDEDTNLSVTFVTTASVTMVAANAYSYFNPTTQRFELSVPAFAISGASASNVAPGRINRPLRALVGFDSVTNRDAATGGVDTESDSALIRRYYLSIRGASPAVTTGISRILRDKYPSVVDSLVVYGNNVLNTRAATDTGAVDVYIIGSSITTITENVIFMGTGVVMPLTYQPVMSIVSIGAYVQGTDFNLVHTNTGYANSTRAADGPQWSPTAATTPTLYDTLTVVYTYNSLMSTLQAAFTQPDSLVVGRDILFKEATQVDVQLTAQLKVRPGYNVAATLAAITSSISVFINNMILSQDVELSDIQAVVRSYVAVDNFIISLMAKVGNTGTTDIIIADNEFTRIAPANLNVTTI